LLKILINCSKS